MSEVETGGSPRDDVTMPVQTEGEPEGGSAPAGVGLNWESVSMRLGIGRSILERDGAIVVRGESFPERGIGIDPFTFSVWDVSIADMAPATCYFVGRLSMDELGLGGTRQGQAPARSGWAPSREGPLIGLFTDRFEAERAQQKILAGSLGSDCSITSGPLGFELRVGRVELPGRTASVIAARGGAVILIAGRPVVEQKEPQVAPSEL